MGARNRRADGTTGALGAAPGAQTGPVVGPPALDASGAVLDNGLVRFRFFTNDAAAPGEEVELEITDLATGHVVHHANRRLWEVEVVTQPVPSPTATFVSVTPDLAPGPVTWTKSNGLDGEEVRLIWTNVPVPGSQAGETVTVALRAALPANAHHAVLNLVGESHLSAHAFYTGRLSLSIAEDPTREESLLTSLGQLVTEPAAVLATSESAWFDMEIRPGTQGSAWYDDAGNGLYLGFRDDTGVMTKIFRYGAAPDHSASIVEALSYSPGLTDPTLDLLTKPLRVGRFTGDWWDAATIYRAWLGSSSITSQGLLAFRPDVPKFLRLYQHAVVMSPLDDYFTPCNEIELVNAKEDFLTPAKAIADVQITSSVAQRLDKYREQWGIEHLSVLQFSPVWPIGGWEGVGQYALAPSWQADIASIENAGIHLWLYLYDSWYRTDTDNPVQQTYAAEGWSHETITQLDGSMKVQDSFVPELEQTLEFAMIDPAAPEWQQRTRALSEQLAQAGADGIYVDNFFPGLSNADFSGTQGKPGYGPDHTTGFRDSIREARDAGRLFNPEFTVSSEVMFEAFLPHSDLFQPEQTSADLITDDSSTRWVPLRSFVYHHWAVLGPAFAGNYTRPPSTPEPEGDCPGFGDEDNTAFSTDPAERQDALRGANWTNAYGWVSGSPIWSPDYGTTNPKCLVFSFELLPPESGVDCFAEYREICAYAARRSTYRGTEAYAPFLDVGVLMRVTRVEELDEGPFTGVGSK